MEKLQKAVAPLAAKENAEVMELMETLAYDKEIV